jgi:hypothetical protein
VNPEGLFDGASFNLDFHSVPYYGEDPVVERHYVSARRRRQPSILAFLAQDAAGRAFCYSNANLRKGEEAEEIFNFISFWKRTHGQLPRHLVFDSRLTTYANLARLDKMEISFITLRRRSPQLLKEIVLLPRSAWRTIELDVPTRQYRTPRVFEQKVSLAGATFRQLFIQDLGHDEPTILLTNQHRLSTKKLITRRFRAAQDSHRVVCGQCVVLGNHSADIQSGHRVSAELFAGVVAKPDAHEAALQAFLVTRGTDSASESPRPAAQGVADATGLGQ